VADETSSSDKIPSRFLLKISTTADCVVQTVDLLLIVGNDKGQLVMFDLTFLDEGRFSFPNPLRTGARFGLGGWLYTKTVYPGLAIYLSTNNLICSNFVDMCNCAMPLRCYGLRVVCLQSILAVLNH